MVVASPSASAGRGERPIVLALTALLTIVSLLSPGRAAAAAGLAAFALTVIAWKRRARGANSLGLLFVTCLALALAGFGPQQVVFGMAFAFYAIVAFRVSWFREATRWLTVGRVDGRIMALGSAFAAVSGAMLLLWYVTARPDLADLVRTFIPDWPLWLLVPAAFVFSVVNAAVEEAAYRGVVLGALETARVTAATALVLQTVAFAALHFRAGFPRGLVGVALTFVYGLVLGELRRRAGGLIEPVHHARAHGPGDRHDRARAGTHVMSTIRCRMLRITPSLGNEKSGSVEWSAPGRLPGLDLASV